MEVTPEKIDAARDAARWVLLNIAALPKRLCKEKRDAERDASPFTNRHMNMAAVFSELREEAARAADAMPRELLDFIALAAEPGAYTVDATVTLSPRSMPPRTVHEATLGLARRAHGLLARAADAAGVAMIEPDLFRGEAERALFERLEAEPVGTLAVFWLRVIMFAPSLQVPAGWWSAIDAECAAAQRAIAAGAQPQGQPDTRNEPGRETTLGGILNPTLSVSREFAQILNPTLSVSQPASVETAPTNEANSIPEPGPVASDAPTQPVGNGQDAAPAGGAQPEKPKAGKRAPKMPPEKARQAYWTRFAVGDNQTTIARKMTENGVPANQGQVSRWLRTVDAFLAAGGILPPLKTLHAKPEPMAPEVFDMGGRQDGRTPRQRGKMLDPADDWG